MSAVFEWGPGVAREKPAFLPHACEECGTVLVLVDREQPEKARWWDEWECPSCKDGVRMDWPPGELERLRS